MYSGVQRLNSDKRRVARVMQRIIDLLEEKLMELGETQDVFVRRIRTTVAFYGCIKGGSREISKKMISPIALLLMN